MTSPQDEHEAFLMELGRAHLRLSTPAHRLEEAMKRVSGKLGLEGEFYSTPTALIASFGGPLRQKTRLVRAEPGDINLGRLVELDEVTERVVGGAISPADGLQHLERIREAPPRTGPALLLASSALASAALSFVFGGAWPHAGVAGFIGLVVGALSLLARRWKSFSRVHELVAAFLASVAAHTGGRYLDAEPVYLTTVTGLILLVPGFTLTVAILELSTANLVSGTARLIGSGVTFLKLAFGVAVGAAIFDDPSPVQVHDATLWVQGAGLLVASLAISILFEAQARDVGWILALSAAGLAGSAAGVHLLGPQLGSSLGALLATAGSNLYSRWARRTPRVPLTPSLILLVPGSVGFQSVALLLQEDAITGVNTAFRMSLAAISLAAGVLFANILLPPRKL